MNKLSEWAKRTSLKWKNDTLSEKIITIISYLICAICITLLVLVVVKVIPSQFVIATIIGVVALCCILNGIINIKNKTSTGKYWLGGGTLALAGAIYLIVRMIQFM